MEYILVQEESKEKFEKEINEKLKEGFTIVGSLSVVLLIKPTDMSSIKSLYHTPLYLYTQSLLKK